MSIYGIIIARLIIVSHLHCTSARHNTCMYSNRSIYVSVPIQRSKRSLNKSERRCWLPVQDPVRERDPNMNSLRHTCSHENDFTSHEKIDLEHRFGSLSTEIAQFDHVIIKRDILTSKCAK